MNEKSLKEVSEFVKNYSTNGNVLTIDEISTLLKNAILDCNLLTLEELARVLKVKQSWVYGQSRQSGPDAIPRVKVGKYLRFILSDVMSWLENQNAN